MRIIVQTSLIFIAINSILYASPISLKFVNGDSLSGDLISASASEITISSDAIKNPITIDKNKLLSATLTDTSDHEPTTNLKIDHIASIKLSDRYKFRERDLVKGQIKDISATTVTLQTQYAGELILDRSLVHSINIASSLTSHYSGPNSLEEWTTFGDENAWKYKNNTLTNTPKRGDIGKELNIPSKAVLRFQLSWQKTNNQRFSIFLYATNIKSANPEAYYQVDINQYDVNVYGYSTTHRRQQLEKNPRRVERIQRTSAEYTIYMDKENGIFHVFIDGIKQYSFKQQAPIKGKFGGALIFKHNQDRLLIKNIELSAWNGIVPTGDNTVNEDIKALGKHAITLANGDSLAGEIKRVNNNVMEVETKYTPIQIPLKVTSEIKLDPLDDNQAKARPNEIKAYYRDGGWIRIDLTKIEANFIYGSNEAFGEKKFKLDAFKKIDWNIYTKEHNLLRSEVDW